MDCEAARIIVAQQAIPVVSSVEFNSGHIIWIVCNVNVLGNDAGQKENQGEEDNGEMHFCWILTIFSGKFD